MSSGLATMAAAVVGSAPCWVGLYIGNRRSLRRQTDEITQITDRQTSDLKAHLADAASAPTPQNGDLP